MVTEDGLTLGGGHTSTIDKSCIREMYAGNIYDFINQCHPNEFNKNLLKELYVYKLF